MSIHTAESFASLRALDRINDYTVSMEAAEMHLQQEFLKAAAGPLHLPVAFALRYDGRHPSAYEVLHDTIDYADFSERAMQILCDVAFGRGDRQADAKALIEDMATKYASMNAEVSD